MSFLKLEKIWWIAKNETITILCPLTDIHVLMSMIFSLFMWKVLCTLRSYLCVCIILLNVFPCFWREEQQCKNVCVFLSTDHCEFPCLNGGQCVHSESCDCSLYQATGHRCQTGKPSAFNVFEWTEWANTIIYSLTEVERLNKTMCQNVKSTTGWFRSQQIDVWERPGQTSELNPIEMLWHDMKKSRSCKKSQKYWWGMV